MLASMHSTLVLVLAGTAWIHTTAAVLLTKKKSVETQPHHCDIIQYTNRVKMLSSR